MTETPTNSLKRNAVGTIGIAFFVLAFAAPLTGIVGIGPIVLGKGGSPGAPGIFLITTVILLIFSVGFAAMSRTHSGPGGFAVYIGTAFGPRAARGAAHIAVIGYTAFLVANIALLSASAAGIISSRFGLNLPWWTYAIVTLAVLAILGYREVKLSVRVLGVLLVAEIVIVLILDASVLGKGGAEGTSLTGFSPTAITTGGVGIVFLMAFAAFVGFEATTLFGEEAKDRHRTIPRATYLAVGIVGVFYILSMWVLQLAWGPSHVAAAASGDATNFLFTVNTRFVGLWSTDVMQVLVITSMLAACLSAHGALSRYLFSMGRAGTLPPRLGTTHPRMRSPHIASITQTVVTTIIVAAMILTGANPLGVVYPWLAGIGSVAILLLYVLASLAVIRALRRSSNPPSIWVSTIAPAIAMVALTGVLVLSIINYGFLTGSTNPVVNSLWVIAPILGIVGFILPRRASATTVGVPVNDAMEANPTSQNQLRDVH